MANTVAHVHCVGNVAKKPYHFAYHTSLSFLNYHLRMPSGKKKSRAVKQKQQEGHKGYTTFAKCAVRLPSPNSSNYHELDNEIDDSTTDMDSSNERGTENETEMSVIAL